MSAALHVTTAGAAVTVEDLTGRHAAPLARAAGTHSGPPHADPDVRVVVEPGHRPFDTTGLRPVTRGVWSGEDAVVLDSVGGSGFSQSWRIHTDALGGTRLEVRARWAPSPVERAAAALRSRADALRAQVLLHYPALWWAVTRGMAPLHVSCLEVDGAVVVLAGPGGVGKTTLVADALAHGARATCDNVAVSDGKVALGLREPLRLAVADGGSATGARTTHGRRAMGWSGQVPELRPDLVVVVRRGDAPLVRPVDPMTARRALVAGTYAAGELRRLWTLTAVLGLATGTGPVHPPVDAIAQRMTSALPCLELQLGRVPGLPLQTLLAPHLGQAHRQGAVR